MAALKADSDFHLRLIVTHTYINENLGVPQGHVSRPLQLRKNDLEETKRNVLECYYSYYIR